MRTSTTWNCILCEKGENTMNTMEFEQRWEMMDAEEEAMIDAMYQEWLASQREEEGETL